MPGGSVSPAEIDAHHHELVASLSSLPPKMAVPCLKDHIEHLPDLAQTPYALYYHVNSLELLAGIVLDPYPIASHVGFLTEYIGFLQRIPSNLSARIPRIELALQRLRVLRAVELALEEKWDAAWADVDGEAPPEGAARDIDRLREWAQALPGCAGLVWPVHAELASAPNDTTLLTVLTDGDAVPDAYREAYLAALRVSLVFKKRREPSPPTVRVVNERDEELPAGDTLKALAGEAFDHALGVAGPQAQAQVRRRQVCITLAVLRPGPVTEVTGRSLLLPLTVAMIRALGMQLNAGAIIEPRPGIVWTGDVDAHGAVREVSRIKDKTDRVIRSRASGFAYPACHHDLVTAVQEASAGARKLQAPLTSLFDLSRSTVARLRSRGVVARAGTSLRRKGRPLGIAGAIAVSLAILAAAVGLPRIASWLDTEVAAAAYPPGSDLVHDRIELFNVSGRMLRWFPIMPVQGSRPIALDVNDDRKREILYGTCVRDSLPGTLFCLDGFGRELWRFQGGFRLDAPKPFDLENTFNTSGPFAHDFDHDGRSEVLAVFNHSPFFAGQLALLTRDGDHVSSFWHPGHFSGAPLANDLHAADFADIDHDGLDEVLIGACNNRLGCPVLVVLDPRSIAGVGPRSFEDTLEAGWQSYVVFPACPPLEETATSIARLAVGGIHVARWAGRPVIRVESIGFLPDGTRAGFSYHLDFDLNLVWFNMDDQVKKWLVRAKREGATTVDVDSPEFWRMMNNVRIIPGNPALREPPGRL